MHPVFINLLRLAAGNSVPCPRQEPPPIVDVEGFEEWQDILGSPWERGRGGPRLKYMVT